MFTYALLFAAVTGGAFLVFDAVTAYLSDNSPLASFTAAVCTFVVTLGIAWFGLWEQTPALHFGNVWTFALICGVIALVIGVIKAFASEEDMSGGAVAAVVFIVCWLIFGAVHGFFKTDDQDMATRLAKSAHVTIEPFGEYPHTDPEHIVLMPEQAARFKADQALNQGESKGVNLTTQYDVNNSALQSIDGHLYWVFDLKTGDWKAANRTKRIVPGYILIDAENTDAHPQLKLGFEMRYTPGAPTANSISRLIWRKYPTYVIDDLTLEVNDDGKPYYTATINRPATTFETALPFKTIVVDPQSGNIAEYPMDDIPEWIDRVYSDDVVTTMLNWWGHWGAGPDKAPFKRINEGKSNRFKVSGDPVLVYVEDEGQGHPEWQVLMTSYRSDTAVTYLALFNGRANQVRLFEIDNLQTEDSVLGVFKNNNQNLQKNRPVHLSLHRIYGRLTWVVSFIPNEDSDSPESLQGLGMIPADAVQATNVIIETSKERLLARYQEVLARGGNSSDDPSSDSQQATVEGVIERVSTTTQGGETTFLVVLAEDPEHVYVGSYDGDLVELPFAAVGSSVTIVYADVASVTRQMIAYDDSTLQLR